MWGNERALRVEGSGGRSELAGSRVRGCGCACVLAAARLAGAGPRALRGRGGEVAGARSMKKAVLGRDRLFGDG